MGRELQKHKNRSSISKVRRKPKSKKRILSNPIIAANWDKSQTLAQNYRRLGLTAKLNKNTGGVEKTLLDVEREQEEDEDEGGRRKDNNALSMTAARRPERLDVTEARIERDPGSGRILKVVDDGKIVGGNPLNDSLNDLDSDSDDAKFEGFDRNPTITNARLASKPAKTPVVAALEDHASRPAAKYKRKQSDGERAFIEELVRKYGEDFAAMARDLRINYMQRSEGDLRRRVGRWREGGGRVVED